MNAQKDVAPRPHAPQRPFAGALPNAATWIVGEPETWSGILVPDPWRSRPAQKCQSRELPTPGWMAGTRHPWRNLDTPPGERGHGCS